MRLNNLLKNYSDSGDPDSVEWTEALLKHAADFEPDVQPVDDFIAKALRKKTRFRMDPFRPLAMGMTGIAGMAAALLVVTVMSKREIMLPQIAPPMPASRDNSSVSTSNQEKPQIGDGSANGVKVQNKAADQGEQSKPESAEQNRSQIQNAGYESRGARRREAGKTNRSVPKVRWENEVVQRYDRGVMAPAYVEEQGHNGEVEYHPVLMPVATETGARPVLIDGGPDATISWTSSPQEASHK